MSKWLALVVALVLAIAAVVAEAASPASNLNGKWAATLHCKATAHGRLVVTGFKASTGRAHWKVTFGGRSVSGTATESGTTVTVNSSTLAAAVGHTGTVSSGAKKMTFHFSESHCVGSGTVVFTRSKPGAGKHHKKHHHKKHHHK